MLLAFFLLAAAELTPENVPNLKLAWKFETNALPPNARTAKNAAFEATPLLAGDLLYIVTPFNQVIALHPATGAERWRYDPQVDKNRSYSESTSRGATVADGTLFLGTLDARLIALDAARGTLRWQVSLGDGKPDGNFQVTSPPVVAGSTVIVGSAIGDNGRAAMPAGTVRAFDTKTGKPKWSWNPTPPGRTGAANAWSLLSVDPARDMVFIPTGSASPDFYGGLRPGDNRHANSVVALRASTGQLLWSFQVVHHDIWDYDVASRPELITFRGQPAVAVLTKVGHYFPLHRLTGKPLLPLEERPTPASDVPGETPSPTQPFPLHGAFTAQRFTPRPGWCTEEWKKLRYDGIFTPPSLRGSLLFPGNVGGANWGSGAYDPQRQLLFVAANRLATAVRLIPREQFHAESTGERWGSEYGTQEGTPFGMARKTFLDPDGRPCNTEPWGALVAIDVETGKLRWETPQLVSLGGPLAVNGVVFFGGTIFETKLRAFSAASGAKLWETDLPYSAHSVPGTYLWKGRRYVVVCAGGHGKVDGSKLGGAVLAYTID